MSKILLAVGAGALVSLLAAGCQGPHPYRTVPPTSISVPSGGSAGGASGGAGTSGGATPSGGANGSSSYTGTNGGNGG